MRILGLALLLALLAGCSGQSIVTVTVTVTPHTTDSIPDSSVNFVVNDAKNRLEVVHATVSADWNRLTVVATSCGPATAVINVGGAAVPHQNAPATAAADAAISTAGCAGPNTPLQVATASASVIAGDWIAFCARNLSAINVQLQIVDNVDNIIVGNYMFSSIPVCE